MEKLQYGLGLAFSKSFKPLLDDLQLTVPVNNSFSDLDEFARPVFCGFFVLIFSLYVCVLVV